MALYEIVDEYTEKHQRIASPMDTANDAAEALTKLEDCRKKYEGTDVHPVLVENGRTGRRIV